jgi:hypothetical protein
MDREANQLGEIINLPPREPTEAEERHFKSIADAIAEMWRQFQRANQQTIKETSTDA